KRSNFPRWAKSKNSFEPTNGTESSIPGFLSLMSGACMRRASKTPAVGIGELTPTPTLSPETTRRAMTAAISSSGVNSAISRCSGEACVALLEIALDIPFVDAATRRFGQKVDECRRDDLLFGLKRFHG